MPKILYLQYYNPAAYPPLEHSSIIMAERGWEILFQGTGALEGADTLVFPPHPNITVHRLPFVPAGWRQKVHYAQFVLWGLWTTLRWRPDWIYASDTMSCPVALPLCVIPGLRVLYHEHDTPSFGEEEKTTLFMRFVEASRQVVAKRASICVIPNAKRARYFRMQTRTKRPLAVVWNCPAVNEVVASNHAGGTEFVVFYHGSVVPSRLPVSVVEALAKVPRNVVLRFAGFETVGSLGYAAELLKKAAELGVADRVQFLGPMKRADLLRECAQVHLGISFLPTKSADPNARWMTGASNKAFDYLACGVPLLMADASDWREMFANAGYGVVCEPNDVEALARVLTWCAEHREELGEMGARGRERVLAEWNYEKQFAPVQRELESRMRAASV